MNNSQKTSKTFAQAMPRVSILIPMRNEETNIGKCLDSVLANDYPSTGMEIIVLDGMSTDRSRDVVRGFVERCPQVHMLENPRRTQASAMNLGIRNARGEIILRMDAHSTCPPDYVKECVTLLETTGASNVGGYLWASGTGYVANAIAIATSSPFGVGDSKFRYSRREEWVDTVFPGAWRKSVLEELGGFNEGWEVNEDYELNFRLRRGGGKILLSPRTYCHYYVRSSLKDLARQYFRYGFWKVRTLVVHPASVRWRHLVPPLLTLGLLISLALMPVSPRVAGTVPALYLSVVVLMSLLAALRRGLRYLPILLLVYPLIHVCWGIGFFRGLARWGVPNISIRFLAQAFKGEL